MPAEPRSAPPCRSAGGAQSLAQRYFVDPQLYAQETRRIFAARWVYAGRGAELADAGRFVRRALAGADLLLVRGADGVARGFHNVCRHRGTRLCAEAEGDTGPAIRCPYHAWTYALDGALTGAPHMRDVDGWDPGRYPLHAVHVREWQGFLFVCLADTPPAFDPFIDPLVERLAPWRPAELVLARRAVYEVAANWKLILQNYSECYHCPTLHPALNRLTPYRDSTNDLESGPILGGPMQLAQGDGSMTMSGQRCAPPLVDGERRSRVYYYDVFPNLLLSLHPDYVMVHRVERIAVDRSRVVCEWLFAPETVADSGFDPSDAVEFWDLTNRQDWHVCELSQQGIASPAYTPGPYGGLESMIAAFDREYLAALGDG